MSQAKHRRSIKRSIRETWIPHLILGVVGLLFLLPFVWTVLTSLKTQEEIFAIPIVWIPEHFQWSNYVEAVNMIPFFRYLWNTVLVAGVSVIGVVLICPLVAYGFSRIQFKGRNTLFYFMLATLMLPYQVTLIPLYVLYNNLGLLDSFWPLWLGAWFGMATNVFMVRQFFMNLPYELSESAKIDGASEFRIYSQIILPLARPAVMTIGLLTFLASWGDFMGPLIYLNSPENWTLSIGLKGYIGETKVAWEQLMAASTLFTVPIVVLYFFVQKQFIEGIALTGFK
ncbi:carbohydrate ABC transporter permease [Paenibacillus alvei]|uniref:Carbohydrate ABC transporter permease n=2 Tax=Paenibacillus alvei TaxID=44250 RepID=A0ABT4GQV4_PAEAL|nr:carbohydrate ABC transporter permease [Paenibacillus alvei]MCY7485869.1 carbohydrate ABC transporter permease [Paenibacillus alvei]MCY9540812.1 carbohydrate ABC transporter permease [Paenibacillus alvei]MCY9705167.1 carbohydrate ABC transporter permease [Paenibacillus alvei]MCY9733786.1 carbohydrate ABC transporter permease [Paenibacillus alvei]MCY9756190.1 carbohydrate ABC transporter permease [Paenibacillus alvei]